MLDSQPRESGHLVNTFDGVIGRRLQCRRCRRDMPEDCFTPIGTKWLKVGGRPKPRVLVHPFCHTCRKQERGLWSKHPEYTSELDRFWTRKRSTLAAGAKNRGILVLIDKDDLLGRYLKQDGYCALTGLKMTPYGGGKRYKSGRQLSTPSVDRIDSSGHYEPDNIQIVLDVVNTMKGELPQDMFIEFCALIASKNLV